MGVRGAARPGPRGGGSRARSHGAVADERTNEDIARAAARRDDARGRGGFSAEYAAAGGDGGAPAAKALRLAPSVAVGGGASSGTRPRVGLIGRSVPVVDAAAASMAAALGAVQVGVAPSWPAPVARVVVS